MWKVVSTLQSSQGHTYLRTDPFRDSRKAYICFLGNLTLSYMVDLETLHFPTW
jgi:hypothetical protein